MALHQAQALAAAKYKLLSEIPLHQNQCIADLTYGGNGNIGISVKRTPVLEDMLPKLYFPENLDSKVSTKVLSYNGDYLGFQFMKNGNRQTRNGVVQGTMTSVYVSVLRYNYEDLIQVWPPIEKKFDRNNDFTPQGIVATRSGSILICLWNNRVDERSLGKVVSEQGFYEIFTDKNKPLFICPTYIAENGNGDICVSDVGAVVVTDAGGMLRFRYQGISANSNFEPYGLCCNSACNIIVADMKNDRIHVIDKDGGFLYTVQYEGIKMPRALCIDEKDNVYVGEWNTDSIKVLSY
ncbi:uncharacterized protein LOC111114751 [Crassostrea virginica]